MELVFFNYRIEEKNIDLVIHHNVITGLLNDSNKAFLNLISLRKLGKGQIIINNEKISKDYIIMNKKRISYVPDTITFPNYIYTVEQLMNNNIKIYNLSMKDSDKKIKDSLKIVGLQESYISRNVNTLSNAERKLITIALGLLSNPDTLILEEPFKYLDLRQEKRLYILLEKLREQYDKTIIIKSEDTNVLYKYTEEIIIIKNGEILTSDKTYETFQRVDFLKRNNIAIPDIVQFTYLAKKRKNVKIEYHRDIRDLIKDIYKHV